MAQNTPDNLRPYLLAAWPGMGNVAVMAAGYLVRKLGMVRVDTVSLEEYFDLNHVSLAGGIVQRPRLPRGLLFRTRPTHVGRPLFVFISEAQPTRKGYEFAHKLLDSVREHDVERVFTIASLASQVHPAEDARVTAAVTTGDLLLELEALSIEPANDGRIGGLNGLLLGAAAEREIDATGLLAEIPGFAVRVPNPKAAQSALAVFGELAEMEIDLEELDAYVDAAEKSMLNMLEQIQRAQESGEEVEFESFDPDDFEPEDFSVEVSEEEHTDDEPGLDPEVEAHIEQLFDEAHHSKAVAHELKEELDKLGLFEAYEDRFLDLFR